MNVRPSSTLPTDVELVQRAQAGDRDAFRQLVERYQTKIAGLAMGMLRNRDDALDVVQEAFTKAYQSLDRFQGHSGFYTWVYRIAMNLCIDQQRRDGRMTPVPLESPDRPEENILPLEAGPRPDQPFDRAREVQIGTRLREAIAELTPEHRAVILLREVEGLSYEEIAEALDVPKGTVMSRLHYARRQLQARLGALL
jgi:RNA polymerase sigma-70 factor, ECF subfamily